MTEPLPQGKRPLSDKMAAATAWLLTGSAAKASEMCGVPARTISDWMQTPAWEVLLAQAKTKKQAELDAKFTAVIHKSAEEMMDRLENGDEVVTKDGTITRRKVSAREAAVVMGIASQNRALIRGEATSLAGRAKGKDLKDVKAELETAGRESPAADGVAAEKLN